MDSRTAASATTSELASRRAKAQSYFERYPERKGQGPYVPSAKLVHSANSSKLATPPLSHPSASSSESPGDSVGLRSSSSRQRMASNDASSSQARLRGNHVDAEQDPVVRQWLAHGAEDNSELLPATADNDRKQANASVRSSSASFTGEQILGSSTAALEVYRAKTAAAAAARLSSTYAAAPAKQSQHSRQVLQEQQQPLSSSLISTAGPDGRGGDGTTRPQGELASSSSFRLHINSAEKALPKTPQSTGSRSTAPDGGASPWGTNASPSVLSIDEIIRRHTPTFSSGRRGSSPLSQSPASPLCPRSLHSSDSGARLDDEGDESDLSDSSLDSVEREVRQTLHVATPSRPRPTFVSTSPALQAQLTTTNPISRKLSAASRGQKGPTMLPHLMAPSVSAPTLLHKKSTPNLVSSSRKSGAVHTRNQSNQMERSASATTLPVDKHGFDEPPRVPKLPRSKSHVDLGGGKATARHLKERSSSSVPPIPPLPQGHHALPPPEADEASLIRRYVQSAKLTRLMKLSRRPYEGKTVSFADVGDPSGHAILVFLGLGAVRYLVGLYDEMAAALNLRLICIDRWGMGKTDDLPAEQRGVLDWSNVVAEVADRLSIDRFSVMAHSAGAPFAMATCLIHGNRMCGPVHLMAPWVSPAIESGYKWLRYVPDGVIRTAQAAEWRMQGWKLGAGAKPIADASENESVDGDNELRDTVGTELATPTLYNVRHDCKGLVPLSPTSSTMAAQRSVDSSIASSLTGSTAPPTPPGSSPSSVAPSIGTASNASTYSQSAGTSRFTQLRPSSETTNVNERTVQHASSPSRASLASLAEHYDLLNAWHGRMPSDPGDRMLPKTPAKEGAWSTYHSHSPSSSTLDTPRGANSPASGFSHSPRTAADLPTELLRASHAESGGSANDLLVILGRASQKPWGFTYADVRHPVRVWHGDKDERVSMSSVLWMEREMVDCRVTLIKGANHGLMTNASVVVEALESIASYCSF